MRDERPFTALGEPALEERVRRDVARLAELVRGALGSSLRALLLGGGYGRGEGGGLRDGGGEWRPLNDYDLVAVVRGVASWRLGGLRQRMTALAESWAGELGIEVELAPLREEDLPRLPFTMMWCELLAAPRVIAGEAETLSRARPLPPASLPQTEGVRYLTNRAALLLWSRLDELPPERVWKFVGKAWLACGAAALTACGRFAVGYAARQSALEGLAAVRPLPLPELVERHRHATHERQSPSPAPSDLASQLQLATAATLVTWSWCEEQRLGWRPPSWDAYAGRAGLFSEPLSARPAPLARARRAPARARHPVDAGGARGRMLSALGGIARLRHRRRAAGLPRTLAGGAGVTGRRVDPASLREATERGIDVTASTEPSCVTNPS